MKRSARPRSAFTGIEKLSAATPSTSRIPRTGSSGVVAVLNMWRTPLSSSSTRSVKVPPVSTAKRICAFLLGNPATQLGRNRDEARPQALPHKREFAHTHTMEAPERQGGPPGAALLAGALRPGAGTFRSPPGDALPAGARPRPLPLEYSLTSFFVSPALIGTGSWGSRIAQPPPDGVIFRGSGELQPARACARRRRGVSAGRNVRPAAARSREASCRRLAPHRAWVFGPEGGHLGGSAIETPPLAPS